MWELKIKTLAWLTEKKTFEQAEMEFEFDTLEKAVEFGELVTTHSRIDKFEIKKKGA